MADASDSKSDGGNLVPVQVRPPAVESLVNRDIRKVFLCHYERYKLVISQLPKCYSARSSYV